MDHVGFPYLSPPLFYYLIGQEDVAITMLRESDVSGQAKYVVAKVNVDTFCKSVLNNSCVLVKIRIIKRCFDR